MKTVKLFAYITKVDETKREVSGLATCEMVDKTGEIFDYETSKPFFQKWSDEIAKATDGKSLGNVREMHTDSAVGKLVNIGFDDELKAIPITAKIVDDDAWEKCIEGVYTGFSIGGRYVKRWEDGEFIRFTAAPFEVSVVDNPAVPAAHFTHVKADGTTEMVKFASVKKGMWTVANFASLFETLAYVQQSSMDEKRWEGDDSPIPAKLKAWIDDGLTILQEMTAEECAELSEYMDVEEAEAIEDYAQMFASGEIKKHAPQIITIPGTMASGSIVINTPQISTYNDLNGVGTVAVQETNKSATADPNKGEEMTPQELQKIQDALDKSASLEKSVGELQVELAEVKKIAAASTEAVEKLTETLTKLFGEPEPIRTTPSTVTVDKSGNAVTTQPAAAAAAPANAAKKSMKDVLSSQQPQVLRPGEQL